MAAPGPRCECEPMPIGYTGAVGAPPRAQDAQAGVSELRPDRRFGGRGPATPVPSAEMPAPAPGSSDTRRYGRRALAIDIAMLAIVAAILTLVSPTDSPTGSIPREPFVWALALPVGIIVMFRLQ